MLQRILNQLREPFTVKQPVLVRQQNYSTGYVPVPGITAAAAHADGDALGTRFTFQVPRSGTISVATYVCRDDEGIEVDLVLFTAPFVETADDAAFAPTDVDMLGFLSTITFSTYKNFGSNQSSMAVNIGLDYVAPDRTLWAQFITRGASTIAANNMPHVALTIRADE